MTLFVLRVRGRTPSPIITGTGTEIRAKDLHKAINKGAYIAGCIDTGLDQVKPVGRG
jgi:hypothetical protein